MDILIVALGLALLGALIYAIILLRTNAQPKDDGTQKLMLEVVENLRKSVVEGDQKSQKNNSGPV